MIASIDPATGAELARFRPQSEQEVDNALSAAAAAQAAWRRRDIAERTPLLRRLAQVLREGKGDYARLITAEMGKPIREAEAEIEKSAVTCDYYAKNAPAQLADRPVDSDAAESSVTYAPLGVVLAVMPWNYPFWQFFRFAAPALAAGNGVVLKHADNVPRCALAVEQAVRDAGAPEGLCRTLLTDVGQVAGIIADPRISAVTLTGSTRAGAIVAAQAAASLKKQVLELGGSDPFVVLADADVPKAAATAVASRFVNTGQSCVNAKRFIVEEAVAEEFVAAFTAGAANLTVGDPADRATAIGPMARSDLRETLHDQVKRSIAAGAELRLGGKPWSGPGWFYPPTVLDHAAPGMAAFDEETFGPVAAISRVTDAAEAIAMANRTAYGLAATLWTGDLDRARGFVRRLDAGAVFVNGMVVSDPRIPFGGIKKSGYGRELGTEGIREFVNVKTIWIGPTPGDTSRLKRRDHPMTASPTEPARSAGAAFPPAVLRTHDLPAYTRGGGAATTPLVTRAVGAEVFLNGTTLFEGGAGIPLHTHNCPESVTILEGEAIAEIDGTEHRLSTFDTTYVAAGTPHRFRNASDTDPMRILWIYASVDATRTIVQTGATSRIDAEHTRPAGSSR